MTNFEHGRLDGASGRTRWVKGHARAQDEYDAGYNPANAERLRRIITASDDRARLAAKCQTHLQTAIGHLTAVLNHQCTATQANQAQEDARQWLRSIGADPK